MKSQTSKVIATVQLLEMPDCETSLCYPVGDPLEIDVTDRVLDLLNNIDEVYPTFNCWLQELILMPGGPAERVIEGCRGNRIWEDICFYNGPVDIVKIVGLEAYPQLQQVLR